MLPLLKSFDSPSLVKRGRQVKPQAQNMAAAGSANLALLVWQEAEGSKEINQLQELPCSFNVRDGADQ